MKDILIIETGTGIVCRKHTPTTAAEAKAIHQSYAAKFFDRTDMRVVSAQRGRYAIGEKYTADFMSQGTYKAWHAFYGLCTRDWKVDTIHTGRHDLLAYQPHPQDFSRGVYIMIDRNGHTTAGYYEGGYPHIGEAIFDPIWRDNFTSLETAISTITSRTGIQLP